MYVRMQVQSLDSFTGLRAGIAVSCGAVCRCGSDAVLLWLWPTAEIPIKPLAQELPYAAGVALKTKMKFQLIWL